MNKQSTKLYYTHCIIEFQAPFDFVGLTRRITQQSPVSNEFEEATTPAPTRKRSIAFLQPTSLKDRLQRCIRWFGWRLLDLYRAASSHRCLQLKFRFRIFILWPGGERVNLPYENLRPLDYPKLRVTLLLLCS